MSCHLQRDPSAILTLPFLAVECDFKSFQHKALPDILDRFGATVQGVSNPRNRPSGAAHIRFEQNVGTLDLLAGALENSSGEVTWGSS
jgi:hypothetical protein